MTPISELNPIEEDKINPSIEPDRSRDLNPTEEKTVEAIQDHLLNAPSFSRRSSLNPTRISLNPSAQPEIGNIALSAGIVQNATASNHETEEAKEVKVEENEWLTELAQDKNFVVRMRELVSDMLAQLARIAEKDRMQVEKTQEEYRRAAHAGARDQRKMGERGILISAISVAINLSQFLLKHPNPDKQRSDREIIQFLAGQAPNFLGVLKDSVQEKQFIHFALRDETLQKISDLNNQKQSSQGSKQEFLQVFQQVIQALKSVSSN